MLSNFVRIRKQFGVGWFLFDLWVYLLAIPCFGFGLLLSKLFFGSKSRYSFLQWKGFSRNVVSLWTFTPMIIANKPYFYKVL